MELPHRRKFLHLAAGAAVAVIQLRLRLLQDGIDAGLVYAWRAGHANPADDVIADLDRYTAVDGDHVRQRGLLAPHRGTQEGSTIERAQERTETHCLAEAAVIREPASV